MWKEYEIGDDCHNIMYLIDNNVLVDMCRLYYKGCCVHSDETEALKRFIIHARKFGIQCHFALMEGSFNWKTNQLDVARMQRTMIAFDALVVSMSDQEIMNHSGSFDPDIKPANIQKSVKYESVFDCRLPKMMFEDGEMRYLFYVVYAACLKIRILQREKNVLLLTKVKELFRFMVHDLNLFLDKEFFLATQLFLGKGEEQNIARGILKPNKAMDVKSLVNAAMDIFQYRMGCFIVESSRNLLHIPAKIILVTQDNAFQQYMERIKTPMTLSSENTITPFDEVSFSIQDRFVDEWETYYNTQIWPEIKRRAIESHMHEMTETERKERLVTIRECIEMMEKQLAGKI